MNLYNYLEKHGELENATSALVYFAKRKNVDINSEIFKCYKMLIINVTTRSGRINYKKLQIEIHEGLLMTGREEGHKQTLLHETAHLIVRMVWGSNAKSHGREWKIVMVYLGVPAKRCSGHAFMKDLRKEKCKLIYSCKKCETEIYAQKPRKIAGRYHINCGGAFYLKEDRRSGRSYNEVTAPRTRSPIFHILGQVEIKRALYRNRWVKPGVYDVVREFKYKKNDIFRGTISILIGGAIFRVTVKDSPEWFVR